MRWNGPCFAGFGFRFRHLWLSKCCRWQLWLNLTRPSCRPVGRWVACRSPTEVTQPAVAWMAMAMTSGLSMAEVPALVDYVPSTNIKLRWWLTHCSHIMTLTSPLEDIISTARHVFPVHDSELSDSSAAWNSNASDELRAPARSAVHVRNLWSCSTGSRQKFLQPLQRKSPAQTVAGMHAASSSRSWRQKHQQENAINCRSDLNTCLEHI